jgi:hypothetical protein
MIVPFADNLNHSNVNVSYQLLHNELTLLPTGPPGDTKHRNPEKYADYFNAEVNPESLDFPVRRKTCRDRLQKAIDDGAVRFGELNTIWDLDDQLRGYVSSTDSEDNDTSSSDEEEEAEGETQIPSEEEVEDENYSEESESSEEEEYKWYEWDDTEHVFFTINTGSKNCYLKGEEVFNCYGRRSNRFLLMHYGFAMTDNIYDSVTFHTWDILNLKSTGET